MADDRSVEMVGGDLALNFANTVGWHARETPDEHLETYADFVQWARRAGVVSAAQAAELIRRDAGAPEQGVRALKQVRQLRETIYRVFAALAAGHSPPARDLTVLTQRAAKALAAASPEWRQGQVSLAWKEAGLEWPAYPIALAAGDLLSSPRRERVRQCGNDPCGWLFVDMTRNRSRRWCTSAECGNVTRVRRFRARARRKA